VCRTGIYSIEDFPDGAETTYTTKAGTTLTVTRRYEVEYAVFWITAPHCLCVDAVLQLAKQML